MLQRSVRVLAVADSMTPHTGLAGVLFAFDQHLVLESDGVEDREWVALSNDRGWSNDCQKRISTLKMKGVDCEQSPDCRVDSSSRGESSTRK